MSTHIYSEPVNLRELEELARAVLPPMAFDYYVSGACDEITLVENQVSYDRIRLSPRMLIDVSKRDLTVDLYGATLSMPVLVAPTAFHKLAHEDGEIATAKAAARAGTVFTLSTLSNSSIEAVSEATDSPKWFQLYVYKDRGITENLVKRAEIAGYKAIVLTVDSPLLGRRERDVRNQFHLPAKLGLANLMQEGLQELPCKDSGSGLAAYIASLYDTAFTWKDVEWLCSITRLPVLVKGILRRDDAVKSLDFGARGIIVSNHGGRQLDTVPSTIEVLPGIVDAINGRVDVLVDGGVRRGTDVIKALCLGAKAVLLGRPILWALSVGGEDGVFKALEMIKAEFDLSLALLGCPSASQLSRDYIYAD